jgi:hypothetical protein
LAVPRLVSWLMLALFVGGPGLRMAAPFLLVSSA